MFEKVVAAIDNDADRAALVVDAATELAQSFHSEVLIVHVREVERAAATVGAGRPGALPPSLHFEDEDEARGLVDSAVDRVRSVGVEASGRIESGEGSTARELLDVAEAFGATLIIVGDRGSRVTDLLLGSVAHKVVHLAHCPVLLVR